MTSISFVTFLLIIALASYLQALTGFALGIFAMGGVIALNISSLPTAALIISVLMVANVTLALRKSWHEINIKLTLITLLGMLPGTLTGLWLLENLNNSSFSILQVLLGVLIIGAGATLFIRPTPRPTLASAKEFGLIGILAGVFGGLYGIAGPPIVYLFYRQPLTTRSIRATLLAIFGIMSAFRLMTVYLKGDITHDAIYLSLISVPVVIVVSTLFALYPPSISDVLVRRSAFVLLSFIGLFVSATALFY